MTGRGADAENADADQSRSADHTGRANLVCPIPRNPLSVSGRRLSHSVDDVQWTALTLSQLWDFCAGIPPESLE